MESRKEWVQQQRPWVFERQLQWYTETYFAVGHTKSNIATLFNSHPCSPTDPCFFFSFLSAIEWIYEIQLRLVHLHVGSADGEFLLELLGSCGKWDRRSKEMYEILSTASILWYFLRGGWLPLDPQYSPIVDTPKSKQQLPSLKLIAPQKNWPSEKKILSSNHQFSGARSEFQDK